MLIAFGVYRATKPQTTDDLANLSNQNNNDSTDTSEINPNQLSVIEPKDQTVQESEKTNVTGTTLPNSFVVIFVNDEETITSADDSGNFSVEVKLANNSNFIEIFAINQDGESSTINRTVIVADPSSLGSDNSDNNEVTTANT